MKNKIINKISLGIACLLGLGGAVTALSTKSNGNEIKQAKADGPVLMIGDHDMIANPSFSSGGGTATYNSSTKTLTLDNFKYEVNTPYHVNVGSGTFECGLYCSDFSTLNIKLNGTNVIKGYSTSSSYDAAGAVITNHVNISPVSDASSTPSLSCYTASTNNPGSCYGFYGHVDCDLTINDCNVSFTGSNAPHISVGIYLFSRLTLNNCNASFVSGNTTLSYSYSRSSAAYIRGNVSFIDSTVTATAGSAAFLSCALDFHVAGGQTTTFNNSTVTATGGSITGFLDDTSRGTYGIFVFNFTSTNSIVNATGGASSTQVNSVGLRSRSEFTVNGGKFIAKGGSSSSGSSYGLDNYYNDKAYANVTNNTVLFQISGKTKAANMKIKNAYAGLGWTNEAGTQGQADIAASSTAKNYDYLKIQFAKIAYTVTGSDPVTYDGAPHQALTVTVTNPTSGYTVSYKLSSSSEWSTSVPSYTDAGTYNVDWKIEATGYTTATGQISFTINRAAVDWTSLPASATDLVFDGTLKDLLSAPGSATEGTVEYSVNGTEYSTAIPQSASAGVYEVRCRVVVDNNHSAPSDIVLYPEIAKADLTNVSVEVTSGEFVYDGTPKAPEVETHATSVFAQTVHFNYSLVDGGPYGEMPTVTEAGTHTVYYEVSANNHNSVYGSFEFTIEKGGSSFEAEPTAIANLKYTGKEQVLVTAGVTHDGVIYYKVDEGDYSAELPVVINVGEYTVTYKIIGDLNHLDSSEHSFKAKILENDKSLLAAAIDEADTLHDIIKVSYPNVATTLKVAIDAADAVYDNRNVTVQQITDAVEALKVAIARATEDSRNIIEDDNSGTSIETSDGTGIPTSIDLRVEVRTDVKAEEGSTDRIKIQNALQGNEKIFEVYDVKLIQTIDGREVEVQPSDIKEGMRIIVHITLKDELANQNFRLIHIHSADDIEEVIEYTLDGNELSFEVDRLSEFAFVVKGAALPGWAIALIAIGSLLLLCCVFLLVLFIFFPRYVVDYSKKQVIRCIYVKKHFDMVLLLDTHLRKVRRNEVDVYKTRSEAEAALKK